MQSVAGRTVLVTGAAMGMGKIYAQLAVQEQAAAVVLWDINQPELEKTAAELQAQGGHVHAYLVDVSKPEQIASAVRGLSSVRGEVRADLDVTSAAEWILWMVISLVTIPGDAVDADDPGQLREFLGFLVRGLG